VKWLRTLSALLILSGCTVIPFTPTPTRIILPVHQVTLPTLPPTWTPVPTRTAPPTFTALPTATTRPTLSAEAQCEAFRLVSAPPEGSALGYADEARFAWRNVPRRGAIGIGVGLEGSGAGIRLVIPSEGDGVFTFSLLRLPSEGIYYWRVWLVHPTYGAICPYTGAFTRLPPTPTAAP
jgi:hypothetical protein